MCKKEVPAADMFDIQLWTHGLCWHVGTLQNEYLLCGAQREGQQTVLQGYITAARSSADNS